MRFVVGFTWLAVNILVLFLVLGFKKEATSCVESTTGACRTVDQYGWPRPYLSLDEGKVELNDSHARRNALTYVLFLIPSLTLAFIIGRFSNRD